MFQTNIPITLALETGKSKSQNVGILGDVTVRTVRKAVECYTLLVAHLPKGVQMLLGRDLFSKLGLGITGIPTRFPNFLEP